MLKYTTMESSNSLPHKLESPDIDVNRVSSVDSGVNQYAQLRWIHQAYLALRE